MTCDKKLPFVICYIFFFLYYFGKLFEKLMVKRLYKYLDNLNTFYPLQFGFRKKHATNHALISMTESIKSTTDDGNYGCGVFIDLKKAFDTKPLYSLEKNGALWCKRYCS